ncbi:MAG: hypothetical protein GYA60_01560 [Candidatus Methanofastidiosa archaeon]|nr:hypothetical protein [Candidatus Methanofastidiosa archaeon]
MSFLDTVKNTLGTAVGLTIPTLTIPTVISVARQNPISQGVLDVAVALAQTPYNPFALPGAINTLLTEPKMSEQEFNQWYWNNNTPNTEDLTPTHIANQYLIEPFSPTSTAYNQSYADLVFLPGISGQFTRAINQTTDQIAKTTGLDKVSDYLTGTGEGPDWGKYVPYLLIGGAVLGGGYLLYKGLGIGNTVKHLYKYEINRKGVKS